MFALRSVSQSLDQSWVQPVSAAETCTQWRKEGVMTPKGCCAGLLAQCGLCASIREVCRNLNNFTIYQLVLRKAGKPN